MYFAQNLKYLREKNGLKQQELAETLGVSQSAIGNWENEYREPDLKMIVQLVDYFGISLDDLVLKDLRPPAPKCAENIRYLRLKHGMKQEDIANLLRVSSATASKYENGKIEPTVSQLLVLADFFGVTLDGMIRRDLSKDGE